MRDAASTARRLALLADLGLERVETSLVMTEAWRVEPRAFKVISRRPAMGTLVSVTGLHASRAAIEEAIGRAFAEMDRLIGLLSRFEGSSAVSVLNQQGRLVDVPPEFGRILSAAIEYHRISGGAFDVTVQPLVDLFWNSARAGWPEGPSPEKILDLLGCVGSQHVTVSAGTISFQRDGMGLTLDGIAKGYIVDRVTAVLEQHGIGRYLVNAGGDIRSAGTKERGQPWSIAVQDPAKQGDFPARIRIRDGAFATSGSYERYFDHRRSFHHIVDSRDGRSPNRSISATVVAGAAMTADALATSAFVMDPSEGVAFIDAIPRCECLIIESNGRQHESKGWRRLVKPTAKGLTQDG